MGLQIAKAQSRIYVEGNCLFTLQGNKIYTGNSTESNSCVYTIVNLSDQLKECTGHSTDVQNSIFTIYNSRIYHGNSTTDDHIAFTIVGTNSYIGNPADYNVPIFRIIGNQVFQANTTNVVATFEGSISKELLTILLR